MTRATFMNPTALHTTGDSFSDSRGHSGPSRELKSSNPYTYPVFVGNWAIGHQLLVG